MSLKLPNGPGTDSRCLTESRRELEGHRDAGDAGELVFAARVSGKVCWSPPTNLLKAKIGSQ